MLEFITNIDYKSKMPIYVQLYNFIKKEIISGRIEEDMKLPSVRQLSQALKISKTTIESAYQQLYAEGYIRSVPKVGFFVNSIEDNVIIEIAKESKVIKEQEIVSKICKYDFKNEYADKNSFDFTLWKKYLKKALTVNNDRFLNYGSHQGEIELRKEIAKYAHQSRGVICTPEQVVLGAGVQSLLNILAGILRDNYMNIGFEDPGFKQARSVFIERDYNILPISLDKDGINIKKLKQSGADIVYVSPSHQFPVGSTMSINKRNKLLNWAHDNNTLIIEDDYDSELRHEGIPVPSLQGLGEGHHVIYLGSFSKILLPSIRISFMILPFELLKKYNEIKENYNQTSSQIEQIALAMFMNDGAFLRHIKKIRKIYSKKNQQITQIIEKIMGNRVIILGKETGLHILLEVKTGYSAEEMTGLAEKIGVRVIPIDKYTLSEERNQFPRVLLSYGGIPIEDIEPAIHLLDEVWFNNQK